MTREEGEERARALGHTLGPWHRLRSGLEEARCTNLTRGIATGRLVPCRALAMLDAGEAFGRALTVECDHRKEMATQDFPALRFIMTDDSWTRPPISPPSECFACPFATARGEEHGFSPPNPSDPGEGYYACALIGKPATSLWAKDYVWGEQPDCTEQDWAFKLASEWAILQARLDPENVNYA